MIQFHVPAAPIPQPRQRHAIRGKGKNAFVTNYTPSKHPVSAFKDAVRLAASKAHKGPLLEGALRVDAIFVLPRPKNKCWKTRPTPRYYHTSAKDIDNLQKALWDALSGTLFIDDGQIAASDSSKVVAAGDEQPHVEVTVFCLETD